jgi:hypothetical protein
VSKTHYAKPARLQKPADPVQAAIQMQQLQPQNAYENRAARVKNLGRNPIPTPMAATRHTVNQIRQVR